MATRQTSRGGCLFAIWILLTPLCRPSVALSPDHSYPMVKSDTVDSAGACVPADLPSLDNGWISVSNCSAQAYLQQQSPGGSIYGITVSSVKYGHPYYAAWIDVTGASACCILRASLNNGRLALQRNQRLEQPCCIKGKPCSDIFDGNRCATD